MSRRLRTKWSPAASTRVMGGSLSWPDGGGEGAVGSRSGRGVGDPDGWPSNPEALRLDGGVELQDRRLPVLEAQLGEPAVAHEREQPSVLREGHSDQPAEREPDGGGVGDDEDATVGMLVDDVVEARREAV